MSTSRSGSPAPIDQNSTASPAPRFLRGAGEAVLFFLVALSPWPFASNDPPFESALSAGVLLLVALWGAHAILTGRFAVRLDVVTLCLGGVAVWTAAQLVPLPESVVGVLSPARLEWHRTLNPDVAEILPGEGGGVARPTTLALTVDPSATRTFLARVLAVLLVYVAARNWLATPAGFRRLAWVLTATGVALAVLALGQAFSSSPNVMYWSLRFEGGVFGPFVCRNHYPDYAAVCLGLAVGLLVPDRRNGHSGDGLAAVLLSPRGVGLAAAAGLIAASIGFSLSRAGILATVAAALGALALARVGRRGHWGGPTAVLGAVLVAVGVFAWFGTERVERRLATLGTADGWDGRSALWRDAARLVPRFWASGTGGDTFVWAEPLVRTGRPTAVAEHAHNEYLEAAVEGGFVRLGLTLALVMGVLVSVGRGFFRRRDRSAGPLLLGAWFGLAVIALHAAADFALHMPAVALLAATVAGFAVAGGDPTPDRKPPAARGRVWAVTGGSVVVAGLAVFVALDARSRERVHRLKVAADLTYRDFDAPDRLARRAVYLDARAALRPDDPVVLFEAAQGRIDAAVEATLAGADPAGDDPDRFPPAVVRDHLVPALRFLRGAGGEPDRPEAAHPAGALRRALRAVRADDRPLRPGEAPPARGSDAVVHERESRAAARRPGRGLGGLAALARPFPAAPGPDPHDRPRVADARRGPRAGAAGRRGGSHGRGRPHVPRPRRARRRPPAVPRSGGRGRSPGRDRRATRRRREGAGRTRAP